MKTLSLSVAAMAAVALVSCGPSAEEQQAAREQAIADSLAMAAGTEHTYTVDAASSSINWTGNMTGAKVYSHNGTIGLNSGSFTTKGGLLTGGSFEVNMTAITPTDNGYAPDGSEQGTKAGLLGHLGSPDFFDVANHPAAKLVITGSTGSTATADLTLRGKTNSETITDITITENADGSAKATGKLVFDRKKYDVVFPGPAADLVLANDIELTVELTGK